MIHWQDVGVEPRPRALQQDGERASIRELSGKGKHAQQTLLCFTKSSRDYCIFAAFMKCSILHVIHVLLLPRDLGTEASRNKNMKLLFTQQVTTVGRPRQRHGTADVRGDMGFN
jgi:hypothetical protein